jgi:hypothetical protein
MGVMEGRVHVDRVRPYEWVIDTLEFATMICVNCGAMQLNITQQDMAKLHGELLKQGYRIPSS